MINNNSYVKQRYDYIFDFNTKFFPFLKKYSLKYDFIDYDSNDPNFIFVRDKKTGKEYYKEINNYECRDLRIFFSDL